MSDFPWCGLAVDFQNGIVVSYSDETEVDDHRSMRIKHVRSFLLNDDLKYPRIIYNRLAGAGVKKDKKKWKNWRHDILFLSLGVAGVEYVKTEGWKYTSKGKEVPVLVETVLGSVTIILQKNDQCFKRAGVLGNEEWFCAKRVIMLSVPRGRKALIPPGYYIVFVNDTLNPAAVSIIVDRDAKEVSAPFSQSRGAAYYAIKKNARLEMVPNPLYRELQPINKLRLSKIWKMLSHSELEDLLYVFLARGEGIFDKLLSGDERWDSELA